MAIATHELIRIFDRLRHRQMQAYEYHTLATSAHHDWSHLAMYEAAIGPMPGGSVVDDTLRYGTYSISLTVSGKVLLGARFDGEQQRSGSLPGHFSLLPPQGISYWDSDSAAQVCHIFLSTELFTRAIAELGKGDPTKVILPFRFNAYDPLAEQIFAALRHELYHPGPVSRLYVESLSQSLALHLLRYQSVDLALPQPSDTVIMPAAIRRAIDYLEAHIAESIGLTELANAAQISPATLNRQFKRVVGLTPHQYLLRQRLEQASILLQQGKLSVTQVAHETGFADHSHLTRCLKRHLGITPRDLLPRDKKIHRIDKNIQDGLG